MTGLNRRAFFATTGLAAAATVSASTPWLDNTLDAADAEPVIDEQLKRQAVWRSSDKQQIWGYVSRHSVAPGEPFDIMLSVGPDHSPIEGHVQISRIGAYDEDRKLVWTSHSLTVQHHPAQITSASMGADWPAAAGKVPTRGWESGYYTIDFVYGDGDDSADFDIAYIVVTNPERSGDVVVGLCTNTYNAYNAWGGYSFYDSAFVGTRAQVLSFDRPAAKEFYEYDYYLVTWLERLAIKEGFKVDYLTNHDIHNDPTQLYYSKLFISGCHNEYWSKQEFDAVHHRIFALGKSVFFFGANTAYWQVRYGDIGSGGLSEDWGRQLICYKSMNDPVTRRSDDPQAHDHVTTRFRHEARRPETMLCGVAFQSFFEPGDEKGPQYAYKVVGADHPFFAGTGWRAGQSIGDVVGYEWDNRDPAGDGKRLWDARTSKIGAIDHSTIQVLFEGRPIDVKGRQGLAEAVYFKPPAGGGVFSSGSIRWAWGFGKPGFQSEAFRAFNRNVVMQLMTAV